MAIIFSKVNISLSEFQRMSKGDYNAGEVRLAGETKLARMNNHVHRRGLNKEVISHEEVIAIKNAFIAALERGGVDANRLAAIRRELGLAAESTVDFSLRERSVKPLSRQQIREILDRNAEVLNHSAPGTIRTSDELYGRLSTGERNERIASRNAVNQSLDSVRTIVANRLIDAVQSFVAGDCLFRPTSDRATLLEDARQVRENLRAFIASENRQPRTDGMCSIRVATAGVVLEIPTGKSERDFLKTLDDIILLLSSHNPHNSEIEVRSDFSRVENTPEARRAFVNSIAGDGLKLRALAVHLMQARSVADAAVLATVNSLHEADLAELCHALLALPDDTRGAGVSAAPAVRTILERPGIVVPLFKRATIPVLSPAAYNPALYNALTKHPENLPPDFRRVLDETTIAMRERFGEALVPQNAELSHLIEVGGLLRVCNEASTRGERYTIETFRESLPNLALTHLAERAVSDALAARATARGIGRDGLGSLAVTILASLPDLATRIRDAAGPEARSAILDESREILDAAIDHMHTVDAFMDEIEHLAHERIAAKTGLPADSLSRVCDFSALRSKADSISKDTLRALLQGKPNALEDARKRLRDMANATADERLAYFAQIDELNLSPLIARTLKTEILGMVKVKDVEIAALSALARNSVNLDDLKELVKNGANVDQIKPAVQQISSALREAVIWHFGEENLGVDEIDRYTKVAALLVLNGDPELVESLRQLCDAPGNEELAEMRFNDILLSCIPDTRFENDALAEDLLGGTLPPFHRKALSDAGIQLPLPEAQAQVLAEQIRQSPVPVSPEELVAIVKPAS